jgi:hypothetical protein
MIKKQLKLIWKLGGIEPPTFPLLGDALPFIATIPNLSNLAQFLNLGVYDLSAVVSVTAFSKLSMILGNSLSNFRS